MCSQPLISTQVMYTTDSYLATWEATRESPKEGDIKLKDEQGNWYVVQGVSRSLPPFTAQSVTIGIIDSGTMINHPQLQGHIGATQDFTGEGIADRIGHGTVVSILTLAPVSQDPSVKNLPTPRLIEAKVANADGTIDKNNVISAIQWAVKQGAKVINMSLGFKEGTDDYSGLCYAIQKSTDTLFVAAAGNFGPLVRVYPAACRLPNLISVSATDCDGKLAAYSGKGDVAAPGCTILAPTSK
jgi:subtilisin family serine protease